MMLTETRPRSGFALVEMMVLIISLAAGMTLGGATLILALQTERAVDQTYHTLVQRRTLAEQFRTDVSRATATPERTYLGEDEVFASPTCLILEGPGKQQVVYLWLSGHLERVQVKGGQALWQRLPVGAKAAGLELSQASGRESLITLRLKEATRNGGPARHFELSAALGGDWR